MATPQKPPVLLPVLFFFQSIQMKYTIHVNQAGADEAGLRGRVDIIDLAVFDAFKDFANSNRCEKKVDDAGRVWFWIDYNLIVVELPYCGLNNKDSVYRRMRKLAEAKIIEFHPENQKTGRSFFSWSVNYDALVTTTKPTDEIPKGPKDLRTTIRRGTDNNPKGYGQQSEGGSDRKPNYHNTNNHTTNQQTKASTAADAPDAGPTVKVEEIEAVEDGRNGTASRGGGPQTKSWSQRAATIFDEVNEAMSKKERLEYSAFNWKVCRDQNFKQLENLKKIIEPGFAEKNNGAMPNDQELDDCFRAYFLKAWQYFYKLQKDTAGAFHYTPTTIYKSFNQIKSFKNGNINGSTTNDPERDIYRRNNFGQGINDFSANHP